jgi:hypothetical protein
MESMAYRIAKYLFLALIFSLPIFRPSILTIAEYKLAITDVLFLGCVIFFAISLILKRSRAVWDRSFIFLFLFALSLSIASVFSETPERSIIKLFGHFYLIGLAVLAVQFTNEQGFWRKAVYAWLAGLSITIGAVLVGLFLFTIGFTTEESNYFLFHFGTLPAGNYPRIMALFANSNMLATYLGVSVPLVLGAAKVEWIGRPLAVILLFGVCIATAFSISPNIGGVILSAGLWLLYAGNDQLDTKVRQLIATGTVIGCLGFFLAATVSLESPNSEKEFRIPGTSIILEPSVRIFTWRSSAETFLKHPLFGKGTGTDAAFVKYQSPAGPRQLLLDAHNMWLSIAAQTGIFGLATFCLLLFHLFRRCRFRPPPVATTDVLHISLSCAFIGGFIYQGLTGSFEDARHIWVVIGLLCGITQKNEIVDQI